MSKTVTVSEVTETMRQWIPDVHLTRGPLPDPTHSLDDAVRAIEAKGLEWSFDTDACGYHYAGIGGNMICYGDNRHAWHLCEAAYSAVKGEQYTMVED